MVSRIAALAGKLVAVTPRVIYGWLGGRHFVLCVFFAVTAAWFEWRGKLTADYAAAITAISGFAVWRAVSEDRKEEKRGRDDDKN